MHRYLRLRGHDAADVAKATESVLNELDLASVSLDRVGTYSGGMQRRLSVALASIGDHVKLLLFDEPTTGLDPVRCGLIDRAVLVPRPSPPSLPPTLSSLHRSIVHVPLDTK